VAGAWQAIFKTFPSNEMYRELMKTAFIHPIHPKYFLKQPSLAFAGFQTYGCATTRAVFGVRQGMLKQDCIFQAWRSVTISAPDF
jgi:hypothetical protein